MSRTRLSIHHGGAEPIQAVVTEGSVFVQAEGPPGHDEGFVVRDPKGHLMMDTVRMLDSDAAWAAELITDRHWLLLDRDGYRVERVRAFTVVGG